MQQQLHVVLKLLILNKIISIFYPKSGIDKKTLRSIFVASEHLPATSRNHFSLKPYIP